MKIFLIILSTVIVTIVLEIAFLAGYIWFKNPFGIKAFLFSASAEKGLSESESMQKTSGSLLSPQQEAVLKDLGVDISQIPEEIPQNTESCFIEKLGSKRVAEIEAGEMPTALDLLKAKPCLELQL